LKNTAVLLGCALALIAPPALAGNYAECMKLVERAPQRAYDLAKEWRDLGDAKFAAEHCMALALFALGDYERSAALLEDLGLRVRQQARVKLPSALPGEGADTDAAPAKPLPPGLAIDLMAQAGNAWLMAEKNEKAFTVLSDALAEPGVTDEQAVEILIDRARARVEMGNLEAAISDLDEALRRGGPRADALAYRAAAHRASSAFASARADIDKALMLEPENVDALLERGNLNQAIGNSEAAIVDWLQVTKLAPGTPSAKAAGDSVAAVRAQQEKEASTPAAPPDRSPPAAAPPVPRPAGGAAPAP
jgi:tetratricopeptide (TPR) repeat protein